MADVAQHGVNDPDSEYPDRDSIQHGYYRHSGDLQRYDRALHADNGGEVSGDLRSGGVIG
jgi:hypothetical protein